MASPKMTYDTVFLKLRSKTKTRSLCGKPVRRYNAGCCTKSFHPKVSQPKIVASGSLPIAPPVSRGVLPSDELFTIAMPVWYELDHPLTVVVSLSRSGCQQQVRFLVSSSMVYNYVVTGDRICESHKVVTHEQRPFSSSKFTRGSGSQSSGNG